MKNFILLQAATHAADRSERACRQREASGGVDVAVFAQPYLVDWLTAQCLPPNIRITSHDKARGSNDFEKVRCILTIGWGRPSEADLLKQARVIAAGFPEAQTIDHASTVVMREIELRNGSAVRVPHYTSTHHIVAALIKHHEADVIQSLWRCRPLDRTPDFPLDGHVFARTPTGLPVDNVCHWIDAACEDLDIDIAAGIVFQRATRRVDYVSQSLIDHYGVDSHNQVPHGPPTRAQQSAAAEAWIEALSMLATDPDWRRFGFKRGTGRGVKRDLALINVRQHPEAQATLERRLGDLVIDFCLIESAEMPEATAVAVDIGDGTFTGGSDVSDVLDDCAASRLLN
jgi:hypothetical protein